MAGQPPPLPDPPAEPLTQDRLVKVAESLIAEWGKLRPILRRMLIFRRWILGAAVLITLLFAWALWDNRQLVHCINSYAQQNAVVQRQRALSGKAQGRALSQLVGSTLQARSHADYVHDVRVYQATVRHAQTIPIPPLPPAACR